MVLESIHANSLIREIRTDGHSPLLVIGSDYKMYVAKNDKGKIPPVSLINECLAAYLLNCFDVKTPDSKIIYIDKGLINSKQGLSLNHRSYYYDTPCFGSKFIKSSIDINKFLITDKKKAYNKISNPLDVFHITLFDTWVENDDRKPTNYNLVLEPGNNRFTVIPIDNAFIFSTQSYQYLNPDYGVAVSVNDHLLVSDLGFLVKKFTAIDNSFVNSERDYFYLCLERCKENFDNFIKEIRVYYSLDADSVNNIKGFLFNEVRNRKVFEEYIYRLEQ